MRVDARYANDFFVKIECVIVTNQQHMEAEIIKIVEQHKFTYVKIEHPDVLEAVHDLLVNDVVREIDDPIYYLYAGVHHYWKRNLDSANGYYLKAIKYGNIAAANNLAAIYKACDEFDLADKYYSMVVKYHLMKANDHNVDSKMRLNKILDGINNLDEYVMLLCQCYEHLDKKHLDRYNKMVHVMHNIPTRAYMEFICVNCKLEKWVTFEICGHSLCGDCHAGGCTLCAKS